MRHYVGLVHRDNDSDFGVSFPDFPGVVTAGASLGEVRALAAQALAFHVEGLVEDGEIIPEPSPLNTVTAGGQCSGVPIMVPLRVK